MNSADANDKKCEAVKTSCGASNKVLLLDGTCASSCPDYNALDETAGVTKKKCTVGAKCTNTDVLKRDGVCTADCPVYEFKNAAGSKKCEVVSCASE